MATVKGKSSNNSGGRQVYVLHPVACVPAAKGGEESENEYVWVLSLGSVSGPIVNVLAYMNRKNSIMEAAYQIDQISKKFGQKCELKVVGLDGKFGECRTYPRSSDPKSSKG